MNSVPWQPDISELGSTSALTTDAARMTVRTTLSFKTMFTIATTFWVYVTISNVLYANSMQTSLAAFSDAQFFAPWTSRVMQHLLVYPLFIVCIWSSLRVDWQSWRAIVVQVLLAGCFSALPFFAMTIAEHLHNQHGNKNASLGSMFTWGDPAEWAMWLASATSFFLTYGFGVALATGFKLYQRFRDSELRFTAMERAWSTARLSALRMQLSPHTLFNLLNTIRGNIKWEPAMAQTMVVQLADLLRQLLNAGETEFSRLRDELTFVRLYLELQQKRFVDRLTLSLPNNDALPATWVPSLILQPLIENAVVHGLAGNKQSVSVRVEVRVDDSMLVLRVINTYTPPSSDHYQKASPGIGLRNITERLAVHFQDRATLTTGPLTDTDWCAEIRLPMLSDGPQGRRNESTIGP